MQDKPCTPHALGQNASSHLTKDTQDKGLHKILEILGSVTQYMYNPRSLLNRLKI